MVESQARVAQHNRLGWVGGPASTGQAGVGWSGLCREVEGCTVHAYECETTIHQYVHDKISLNVRGHLAEGRTGHNYLFFD